MKLLHALFAASLLALAPFGAAQSFPDKPIQLIVGFPPGGGVDIVARQLADKLSEQLGQRVVVENKPGAAGNVAMEYVARAKPDGYTLLMGNLGMLTANPALYPKLPFDPGQDFIPIARVVVTPLVAVVPASLPVQDMTQFLALARAKPGELNFGSGGNGNINHLAGELLKLQTTTQMQHVPYKGSAPCIDRSGGWPHPAHDRWRQRRAALHQGRPRAATARHRRHALAGAARRADLERGGLPQFVIYGWQGVLAPKGTPQPIIDRLSAEIKKALESPDLKNRLSSQGTEPAYLPSPEFRSYIAAELTRWTNVIRSAKITLD